MSRDAFASGAGNETEEIPTALVVPDLVDSRSKAGAYSHPPQSVTPPHLCAPASETPLQLHSLEPLHGVARAVKLWIG